MQCMPVGHQRTAVRFINDPPLINPLQPDRISMYTYSESCMWSIRRDGIGKKIIAGRCGMPGRIAIKMGSVANATMHLLTDIRVCTYGSDGSYIFKIGFQTY